MARPECLFSSSRLISLEASFFHISYLHGSRRAGIDVSICKTLLKTGYGKYRAALADFHVTVFLFSADETFTDYDHSFCNTTIILLASKINASNRFQATTKIHGLTMIDFRVLTKSIMGQILGNCDFIASHYPRNCGAG